LHLAAKFGSVQMCKAIVMSDASEYEAVSMNDNITDIKGMLNP